MDRPMRPFATATLSATTSSSRAALAEQGDAVRFLIPYGGEIAYFRFGDDEVVATTSDTPLNPGTVEVFGRLASDTHVAVIVADDAQTVMVTTGQGT